MEQQVREMAEMQDSYGEQAYWEDWYTSTTSTFEWYMGYPDLEPLLKRTMSKNSITLMVGAGNSLLPQQMFLAGYEKMVCVDYSPVVVEQMVKRLQKLKLTPPNYVYEKMDAGNMTFETNSFDNVIDKGTMDAIMCSPDGHETVFKMFQEVSRVLKPGGKYMLISFNMVLALLNQSNFHWTINFRPFRTRFASTCFIYAMQKLE